MDWPDPNDLSSLLAHLSTFGELYPIELGRAAQRWLPMLAEAGWIVPVDGDMYAATTAYMALPNEMPAPERLRRICFAIPAYRRYLVAVLAQGLVQAGQVDQTSYYAQLEQWVVQVLAGLAGEINALLDELEAGSGRMVEWTPERVVARFDAWHTHNERDIEWDRALLGLSGTPTQLFSAVVSHAESFAVLEPAAVSSQLPVALLPDFDLTKDAGRLVLPSPKPWSTVRQSVYSSLPFFDAKGKPLYDATQTIQDIWQDVLVQQPYYRAVLRTVIAARLSGYGPEALALFVPDELGDVSLLIKDRERRRLADLLPSLVETLGYRALSKPSPARLGRILEHWIDVDALEVRAGQVVLGEPYTKTLYGRRRATRLLRGPAYKEQARLAKFLKEIK